MPVKGRLPRRRFLEVAASGAAATAACSGPKSRWRFFTEPEAAAMAAVCDQVIPPDQDPGASQAGAVEFLDRQLTGHYRKLQKQYREGIAALDALSRERHGKAFAEAAPADQLALLTAIDKGKAGGRELRDFFNAVVNHTMLGYYGNPRHGGNKNWASWRMMGVPSSPVRGRLHYDLTRS